MRYLIIIIAFLLIPNVFFAQQTYVPDDNFEQALINKGYDEGPLNDSVPTKNIDTLVWLRIDRKNISDLTGIEDFKALEDLICADNELTSLDLSNNYVLTRLYCGDNSLTSIDVSNNTALKSLSCGDNSLTSLDVSNNSALEGLYCGDNELTSLDLNNNTALGNLDCIGNNLTSLKLSNNSALRILNCSRNNLISLDVSNNTALKKLWCTTNNLTSIDLSNNFNLEEFYCNNNNLTSLNIKNGNNINISDIRAGIYFNATDNPDLECIQVDDSTWSANSFNWKKDEHAHYSEDCGYSDDNRMTYVPDDNFEKRLIFLGLDSGELNDSVPTANIDTVTELNVSYKSIEDLTGIEDFVALQHLECWNSDLTSLDMSNNIALKKLVCWGNNLTNLNVSNNHVLEYLDCLNNKLISLDLSNNLALTELACSSNKIISLDLSNNPALRILYCSANSLTSLDLSNNPALEILACAFNNLSELDLSNNLALSELSFKSTNIKSLDLSKNTALRKLYCKENKLISLNIRNGNNKNMIGDDLEIYFDASGNPDLVCIEVDDSTWSANAEKWRKDEHAHYSEDCGYTGVEEFLTEGTEVSIFPNPAGKYFTVSFELETPKTLTMTLTDLTGNGLQEFTLTNIQYVKEEIDVSKLSSGVYFLRISFGNESISRKIVVE